MVQPDQEEQYRNELNSYNKQQLRLVTFFTLPFALILLLRTLLSEGNLESGLLNSLFIFVYAGILLTGLLLLLCQKALRKKMTLEQSSRIQFVFILLYALFLLGIAVLNVLVSQEISAYLILTLFLSAAVWLNLKSYSTLSILSFILIVFFLYVSASPSAQLNMRFIQLIIYFALGWFLYLSMTSLLMENFYNRLSLEEQYKQLATESITDPLTGLYNKRSFNDDLKKEWARSQRSKLPFCVIMMDIDDFRSVNETFGHIAGDQLIRELSDMIRNEVRLSDKVYRYGGEEFLVLVPESTLEVTAAVAERIRGVIEKNHFSGVRKSVTVSMGIAQSEEDINIDILVNRADQKLLLAKKNGRNRIEL